MYPEFTKPIPYELDVVKYYFLRWGLIDLPSLHTGENVVNNYEYNNIDKRRLGVPYETNKKGRDVSKNKKDINW